MLGAAGCGNSVEPTGNPGGLEYRLPELLQISQQLPADAVAAPGKPMSTFSESIEGANLSAGRDVTSSESSGGVAQAVLNLTVPGRDVAPLLTGRVLAPYEPLMRAAELQYGLQSGLLSAIAILESSGGVNACGFNAWGYASCRSTFDSWEEGIEVVAKTLASYGLDTPGMLCNWVSGNGACGTEHGRQYRDRGLTLLRVE